MKPYNPLEKENLGKSVALSLIRQPAVSLADVPRFRGAGVYAIYYSGAFGAYRPLVRLNQESPDQEVPIYVGRATPKGARKGIVEADAAEKGASLSLRLQEHKCSIEQASNLCLGDFHCRYLIVDDIWIPLGESLLIRHFIPLWNLLIEGFGNHNPGIGRYLGAKPLWDVLHPGRPWAEKCGAPAMQQQEILARIEAYWKTYHPPRTLA